MSRAAVATPRVGGAPHSLRYCTKPRCGGSLEPSTSQGRSIDECKKCGSVYPVGGGSVTPMPAAGNLRLAEKCPVKDCPGNLDDRRQCACCARRNAFLEQNLPKRKCGICEGPIVGRQLRFCKACGPVATKVNVAKVKAGGKKSR